MLESGVIDRESGICRRHIDNDEAARFSSSAQCVGRDSFVGVVRFKRQDLIASSDGSCEGEHAVVGDTRGVGTTTVVLDWGITADETKLVHSGLDVDSRTSTARKQQQDVQRPERAEEGVAHPRKTAAGERVHFTEPPWDSATL